MSSIRSIKLFFNCIFYVLIAILGLIAAVRGSDVDLMSFDRTIVAFAMLGVIINIVTFIVSVCKSEAFRQYQIDKRNN